MHDWALDRSPAKAQTTQQKASSAASFSGRLFDRTLTDFCPVSEEAVGLLKAAHEARVHCHFDAVGWGSGPKWARPVGHRRPVRHHGWKSWKYGQQWFEQMNLDFIRMLSVSGPLRSGLQVMRTLRAFSTEVLRCIDPLPLSGSQDRRTSLLKQNNPHRTN